jgi:hypothetical protein
LKFDKINISLNSVAYFVIDKTVAKFDLTAFLTGKLAGYEFSTSSFAEIAIGLDNAGIPKLSSNKLRLFFVKYD